MNYGELRAHFLDILNRDDCTPAQADTFISLGLRRTERLLRTPIQKTTLVKTIDWTWPSYEPIPNDYIGLWSVSVNDFPIPRITKGQVGTMSGFIIDGAKIKFYPDLSEGDNLEIVYYNEFFRTSDDNLVTDYSLILTDVAVYGALVFAADTFLDARKDSWNATYTGLIAEVQMMSDMDEMSGGSMAFVPYGGGVV